MTVLIQADSNYQNSLYVKISFQKKIYSVVFFLNTGEEKFLKFLGLRISDMLPLEFRTQIPIVRKLGMSEISHFPLFRYLMKNFPVRKLNPEFQ